LIPAYSQPLVPQVSIVDHAHSLYDELIRVPLIMRLPGVKPARETIDNQVRLIDVAPTVLDALDIKTDNRFQGISLLDLIQTGSREEDPPAVSEFLQMGPERKSVRADGFKYIWIEHPERFWNFTFRTVRAEELFHLKTDPNELADVFQERSEIARRYHALLKERQKESSAINEALQINFKPANESPRKFSKETADKLKALGYLK
jgi:arylsulfatase A-like enzyme